MESFKFGNGKWAVKEDYALAYNDENGNFKPLPFDFNRNSIGTRVNREGLIEVVPSGRPRIDFLNNTSGHLLLEPSRTNYLLYSEDLSQSNWIKTNAGTGVAPTITANYATSPDGSQNASRVQFDINGGTTISDRSRLYQDAGTGTSGSQAYSVYVKSNDGSTHTIVFRALGGSFNEKTVTTEWQRIDMVATDNSFYFELGLYGDSATADTADILVWGAQMEEGSYATSYIPTSGSTVTRSAEEANGAGNSQVFDNDTGVWFIDLERIGIQSGRAMMLANSSGSEQIRLHFDAPTGQIRFRDNKNGLATIGGNISMGASTRKKIALKIDSTTLKVFADGSQVGSNYTRPTAFDIHLMYASDDAFKLFDTRFYNTALSDSELQALTS